MLGQCGSTIRVRERESKGRAAWKREIKGMWVGVQCDRSWAMLDGG